MDRTSGMSKKFNDSFAASLAQSTNITPALSLEFYIFNKFPFSPKFKA